MTIPDPTHRATLSSDAANATSAELAISEVVRMRHSCRGFLSRPVVDAAIEEALTDAHGLGGVPQTSLGFFASTIRDKLGEPTNLKLPFGISFGYPDAEAPMNQSATTDKGRMTWKTK